MKLLSYTARFRLVLALLVLALVVLATTGVPAVYSQGVGAPITGYAWSSNIGWVSLSGSNYGLAVGAGGVITGYAWGSNLGWVSAYAADTGSCGGQATVSGSNVVGYLRALNTGSDGCIKLNPTGSSANDVQYSSGAISGYAWGSDTVGWLQFNGSTSLGAPTCSMNSSPAVVYSGSLPPSFTISYNTQNATAASITANPATSPAPGSVDPLGTSVSFSTPSSPAVTTTYTMTVNGTGSGTCQTTLTVLAGSAPSGGCMSVDVANPTCTPPVAKTGSAKKGTAATLYWTVSNIGVGGCSVTKNGSSFLTGQLAANVLGVSTGAITQRSTYVLSCTALDGSTFTDTAVINILPEFQEI